MATGISSEDAAADTGFMSTNPPPGFYRDAEDPNLERWWDGANWTDFTRTYHEEPSTRSRVKESVDGLLDAVSEHAGEQQSQSRDKQFGLKERIFVTVFGILFMSIPLLMAFFSSPPEMADPVQGYAKVTQVTRSSGQGSCQVSYQYEVAGVVYEGHSTLGSTSLCSRYQGESISIRYDRAQPQISSMKILKSDVLGLSFFVLLGFVIFVVSVRGLVVEIRRRRRDSSSK